MIAEILGTGRFERILKMLDLERKLILNGPLAELKPLVERRETALDELLSGGAEMPEAFLQALKAKAERNSRLILASLAGVKSANTQIDRITTAREQLRTYNAAGEPVEVRQTKVTRDQRA